MRYLTGIGLIVTTVLAEPAFVARTGDALGGSSTTFTLISRPSESSGRFVNLVAMPNWPRTVGTNPNYKPTGVTLADVNGDDTLEVIVGSTDNTMHVWDIHGNELAGWPKSMAGMVQSKVAVGDLTGDGVMELVVAVRNGNVYAFKPDGSSVPGWPQSAGGGCGFISPTLADLDGDESLEVIIPQFTSGAGRVNVWRHDGTVFPGWPQSTDYLAVATASVGDVDNDGVPEICAPSYRTLFLWDRDGNTEPGWPVNLGDGASYAQPELYDLDRDGKLEIGYTAYPNQGNGKLHVFRYDGTLYPGWPQEMQNVPQPYVSPAAGGFGTDTMYSLFCGGHLFGGPSFHAWTQDGNLLPGWPLLPEMQECSPVVFDIEGEYQRAVMVADNSTPGHLDAYYADGSAVPGFPAATPGAALPNSPAVADVDLDGSTEVALMTSDGSVSLWKVEGVKYHPWLTDWGNWFHDNWHTGWLHPCAPVGLSAARGNPGVRLTWDANPEPDVVGYMVYRTLSPGRDYLSLTPRLIPDAAFHDSSALGDTTFYYAVSAVIRAGTEGRLSTEVGFNPSGVAEGTPGKIQPGGVSLATVQRNSLFLPGTESAVLLDITGHRAARLQPGRNDLGRVAPGIYFVTASNCVPVRIVKVR